jgi:hypothetical protein
MIEPQSACHHRNRRRWHVRSFGSVLWGLLVVIVLAGIGVGIYNAGLQQGIVQSADLPAGTVPYAAYGGHWDGGIFGLFFPILFLFILFGIARAAFGHRRGWGHGYGYGPGRWGYGRGPWMGPNGPTGSGSDREQWVAEMHRRLHEAEGTDPNASGSASGSGTPGTGPGAGTPPAS